MPRFGSLVTMYNGEEVKVNSFNQHDINSSAIYYKHSGTLTGWTQDDKFEFSVNTLYADPLPAQSMSIYISYGNLNEENKDQLIRNRPIKVDEGAEMIIASNNLDVSEFVRNLERLGKRANLQFSLLDPPKHGILKFRGGRLRKNKKFSQFDIDHRHLAYQHDDSDTVLDTFNLTLHLQIQDSLNQDNKETTFGLVLNITVQPVNDQPVRLLTDPKLTVIQGFSVIIDQTMLNTADKDTQPPYIVYQINREPSNGHVAFVDNPTVKINLFTQQDINDGRVMFQHNFHRNSGMFQFQVSDGSFGPYFKSFRINMTKVSIALTNNATITVLQSNTSALVTQENLNVSTNGLRGKVIYSLVRMPRFGKFYVLGKETRSFTQEQVDNNAVFYVQRDLDSSSDRFEVALMYNHDAHSQVTFNSRVPMYVHVKPLVNMGPLEAPKSERVAITLLSLDASLLAERTGDDPVYTIKHGPYFGDIVKSLRTKRQIGPGGGRRSDHTVVREFSHEDIVYMKIYYISNVFNTPNHVQDNFTFVLKAYRAQPAEGVFYIGLTPSKKIPLVPVSHSPDTQEETSTNMPVTLPGKDTSKQNLPDNRTVEPSHLNNHVIILAISVPLFLLIVTVVIICFVRKRRRKQDYTPAAKRSPRPRPHISGPLSIEQPHVHIQPQERGSPVSDESESLIVEYENTIQTIPRVSRAGSEEADVITPMIMSLPEHHLHTPRSPDLSRTEVSSTVPTCKVTPLVNNEEELEGAVGGYSSENRNSIGSMGDMIEWITNDPELLQHCSSSSPPVLRKSQYWV